MVPDPTDEALLQAHIDGADAGAFAALYHRYARRIHGMFRQGGLPEELCDELLQQTFLHVHRARRDFRPGGRVRPWLFAIALNTRREHFRWRLSRPEVAVEEPPEASSPPDASSLTDRAVRRALAALPEDQREVILLHWYEDLPYDEIAAILGISVPAAKVRAHRGYERLRALLGLR